MMQEFAGGSIWKEKHDAKVRNNQIEEQQVYLQDHLQQNSNAWSSVLYKIVRVPAPVGAWMMMAYR